MNFYRILQKIKKACNNVEREENSNLSALPQYYASFGEKRLFAPKLTTKIKVYRSVVIFKALK